MTAPRLQPGRRLHFDRVRDRWVLLAPERVIELDETAKAIVERLDGRATIEDIAGALGAEYDGELSDIAVDVSALLGELHSKGHVAL